MLQGTWIVSKNGRVVNEGEKVLVYQWENGCVTYLTKGANGEDIDVDLPADEVKSLGDVYKWLGWDSTFTCHECERQEEPSQWTTGQHLKALKECHRCNFWLEKIRRKNRQVIVDQDWNSYGISDEPSHKEWQRNHSFYGYGGRRFEFKPLSSPNGEPVETIVSHNVWFGGMVPERFRDRLSQTHEIIPNGDRLGW
jgi:NAD-dependent SIR2 family protein deacetylase